MWDLIFLLVAFVMVLPGWAQEKEYASVAPDHTLVELGCSIAKAFKDPGAWERCSLIGGSKQDNPTQKNRQQNNVEIVKNNNLNI